jgi:hypothetical protein
VVRMRNRSYTLLLQSTGKLDSWYFLDFFSGELEGCIEKITKFPVVVDRDKYFNFGANETAEQKRRMLDAFRIQDF